MRRAPGYTMYLSYKYGLLWVFIIIVFIIIIIIVIGQLYDGSGIFWCVMDRMRFLSLSISLSLSLSLSLIHTLRVSAFCTLHVCLRTITYRNAHRHNGHVIDLIIIIIIIIILLYHYVYYYVLIGRSGGRCTTCELKIVFR